MVQVMCVLPLDFAIKLDMKSLIFIHGANRLQDDLDHYEQMLNRLLETQKQIKCPQTKCSSSEMFLFCVRVNTTNNLSQNLGFCLQRQFSSIELDFVSKQKRKVFQVSCFRISKYTRTKTIIDVCLTLLLTTQQSKVLVKHVLQQRRRSLTVHGAIVEGKLFQKDKIQINTSRSTLKLEQHLLQKLKKKYAKHKSSYLRFIGTKVTVVFKQEEFNRVDIIVHKKK